MGIQRHVREGLFIQLSGEMAGAGGLALHNGVVGYVRASPFPGRCGGGARIGKAEADGGKRSDPVLLCSL